MMDVKKLVIGFLVLAVATSASALMISGIGGSAAADNTAIISGAAAQPAAPIAANAFAPQQTAPTVTLFGADVDPELASSTDVVASDPNNLTNVLASAYLNGLVSTNPAGPQVDTSGAPSLTPPDNSQIITELASSSALRNVRIPNWDTEAAEIPILPIASSSDAVTNYSAAVQNIFNQQFVQTSAQSVLQGGDPGAANYVGGKIKTALGDVAGLQTPQSLVSFQKSLIKMLVYEKNTVALIDASSTDPLKTALILQGEREKYTAALQNLKNELQKNPAVGALSMNATPEKEQNMILAFIENVAGVPTAHAQFAAVVFDPTAFAQMIIEYAENLALQLLKNFIVHEMQQTVLRWVQGNGVPRIIQSWGTTLVNAYTAAAVNVINQQIACVNPAFAPQVKILLTIPTPNVGGGNNACAFQFQAQLTGNNLTNFYNNFTNGGFPTYLAMFQPGGNMFGAAIDIQDRAMNAGASNQQAIQAKSISGQGFTGSQVCADGSNPNGTHFVCPDGSNPSAAGLCFVVGQQPYPAALQPNGGQCADGREPQVTLPGQATAQVFNTTVDSGPKLVTAANDIIGLLNAFLTSFLNSLANTAITAVNGALP